MTKTTEKPPKRVAVLDAVKPKVKPLKFPFLAQAKVTMLQLVEQCRFKAKQEAHEQDNA